LSFVPHHSAFNSSGIAVLPILLAGELGTLTITPTSATFFMTFLKQKMSFVNVKVCQHTISTGLSLARKQAQTLALPSPCATANATSAVVSTGRCALSPPVANKKWAQRVVAINRTHSTLAACQQFATDHHYCGYEHHNASSTCVLVTGSACDTVSAAPNPDVALGKLKCDYSDVLAEPRVDVKHVTLHSATEFAGFSLVPSPAVPSALDSPVYSMALPTAAACQAQAVAQQACGFLFVSAYTGPSVGSCSAAAKRCCFLNPYLGCAAGAAGRFTRFGAATFGVFGPVKGTSTPTI